MNFFNYIKCTKISQPMGAEMSRFRIHIRGWNAIVFFSLPDVLWMKYPNIHFFPICVYLLACIYSFLKFEVCLFVSGSKYKISCFQTARMLPEPELYSACWTIRSSQLPFRILGFFLSWIVRTWWCLYLMQAVMLLRLYLRKMVILLLPSTVTNWLQTGSYFKKDYVVILFNQIISIAVADRGDFFSWEEVLLILSYPKNIWGFLFSVP